MTNDELREAAELAGLIVEPFVEISGGERWGSRILSKSRDMYIYWNDPMLPAYVASLLVAKVKADASHRSTFRTKTWYSDDANYQGMAFATDEQRIRAAVAVLKETGND